MLAQFVSVKRVPHDSVETIYIKCNVVPGFTYTRHVTYTGDYVL